MLITSLFKISEMFVHVCHVFFRVAVFNAAGEVKSFLEIAGDAVKFHKPGSNLPPSENIIA